MIDTDDALFAAKLHVRNGTMLSAEVVTAICKAYLDLVEKDDTLRTVITTMLDKHSHDANGSPVHDAP